MNTHFITYSDDKYEINRKKLEKDAHCYGFNKIFSYRPEDIHVNFLIENNYILNQKRGAGYWLWKPYFILKTLNEIDDGDILFYLDSGDSMYPGIIEFIKSVEINNILLRVCEGNIQKKFTKRDCFILMNSDNEYFWNIDQVEAGSILLKNSNETKNFVKEWLEFCKNKNILTDEPNICGLSNFPEFIDHRHDQSILTILAYKNNFTFNNGLYDFIKNNTFKI